MKPEHLIQKKLFQGEPVHLPGLGKITPVPQGASIHPGDHQFEPPRVKLHFEHNEEETDHGFIDFVAKQGNTSKKEAKKTLEQWIQSLYTELKAGKKVQLHHIGFLYYDHQGSIQLDTDQNINYRTDSYGLPRFKAKLVVPKPETAKTKQESATQKQGKNTEKTKTRLTKTESSKYQKDKKKTKTKKNRAGRIIVPVILLLVLTLTTWYFQDSWKSWFNFKAPEKTTISDQNSTPDDLQSTQKEETDFPDQMSAADSSSKADKDTTSTIASTGQSERKLTDKQAGQGDYLIIAGCFRSRQNAENMVNKLQGQYKKASIQGKTQQGLHRVVYDFYEERQQAYQAYRRIQKIDSGAWLTAY